MKSKAIVEPYRTDHLGSIREVVDSTGTLTARYDYDAWGVLETVSGSFDLDFGYTGHFIHHPSGLHLAPFRAYDPTLGRWISRDPIREAGGINLYGYVEGDPVNYFDILGLNRNPWSRTHFNNGTFRIDSEVPPGGNGGSLHIQTKKPNRKYDFNTRTGQFTCRDTGAQLPKNILKQLKNNRRVSTAISAGMNRVNRQAGGFAPRFGGGLGRYIPAIGAIALAVNFDEAEASIEAYLTAVQRGDRLGVAFAAKDISSFAGVFQNSLFESLMNAAEDTMCKP